jgi:predicted phosphoadenosine phosphosulfate sulfurtransferase
MWESRCYFAGIPDEAPEALAKQGRAPSYKAIAMAILKNDHSLKSLGMGIGESQTSLALIQKRKDENSRQGRLF